MNRLPLTQRSRALFWGALSVFVFWVVLVIFFAFVDDSPSPVGYMYLAFFAAAIIGIPIFLVALGISYLFTRNLGDSFYFAVIVVGLFPLSFRLWMLLQSFFAGTNF